MPLSIDEATGTIIIEGGRDDDQAGIRIRQSGDAFDRYAILPDGSILKGDGTTSPADPTADLGDLVSRSMYDTPVGVHSGVLQTITGFSHEGQPGDGGNSMHWDADTDKIIIDASGLYRISGEFDFSGITTRGHGIYAIGSTTSTVGDYVDVEDPTLTTRWRSVNGVLRLVAGDEVFARACDNNQLGAGTVVDYANMTVERIG